MIDTSSTKNYDFFDKVSRSINSIFNYIADEIDNWVTETAKKSKGILHYRDAYKQELSETFMKF